MAKQLVELAGHYGSWVGLGGSFDHCLILLELKKEEKRESVLSLSLVRPFSCYMQMPFVQFIQKTRCGKNISVRVVQQKKVRQANYFSSLTQASTCRIRSFKDKEIHAPFKSLLPMVLCSVEFIFILISII